MDISLYGKSGDFPLYGFTVEFNRVGLIRLGKGQHAVWMHSALPRLGSIPLGCGTGGHDDCGTNSGEMDAYCPFRGFFEEPAVSQ